jgi:predicted SAM-dependent methyltransferase
MKERKSVKLNLGCGWVYKVGWLNIDKYNTTVADIICDIAVLPFTSDSVEILEASHVIEHFDYIHCKYLLSEWFRVLRPGGTLVIETPDLETSFKNFLKGKKGCKEKTLQWIYGIDSPGMQHKTGFTYNFLKELLREIGFEKIQKERPKSYTNEPGIRIVCRKPINCREKQFFAEFRVTLKNKLDFDDSFLLIPLEKYVKKAIEIFRKRSHDWEKQIISEISLHYPLIPKIFIEEALNFGFSNNLSKNIPSFTNLLVKEDFSNRIFSLWIKRKKSLNVVEDYKKFVREIRYTVYSLIKNDQIETRRLEYILTLPPENLKVFDFDLMMIEAFKLFNLGLKMFHKGKYDKAEELLTKSSNINPSNPWVWWNLARIGIAIGYEKNKIKEYYEKAYTLLEDKEFKKAVKSELNIFHTNSKEIPLQPVWKEILNSTLF